MPPARTCGTSKKGVEGALGSPFSKGAKFLPLTAPRISVSLGFRTGESYLEFSSKYLGGKQLSKFNYSPVLFFA
jgi:hypothetical protein